MMRPALVLILSLCTLGSLGTLGSLLAAPLDVSDQYSKIYGFFGLNNRFDTLKTKAGFAKGDLEDAESARSEAIDAKAAYDQAVIDWENAHGTSLPTSLQLSAYYMNMFSTLQSRLDVMESQTIDDLIEDATTCQSDAECCYSGAEATDENDPGAQQVLTELNNAISHYKDALDALATEIDEANVMIDPDGSDPGRSTKADFELCTDYFTQKKADVVNAM